MDYRTLIGATALCSFASFSHAYMVDVDPAKFASGTDISNAFEGVTLASYNVDPILSYEDWYYGNYTPVVTQTAIYSQLCSPCSPVTEGQSVFSTAPSAEGVTFLSADAVRGVYANDPLLTSTSWMRFGMNALLVTFDEGTDYFSLVGGGRHTADFFLADLWDTEGGYIGRCVGAPTPLGNTSPCDYELLPSAVDIYDNYTYGQWQFTYNGDKKVGAITTGGYSGYQYVRSLSYAAPEPGTFAVMALPLILLMTTRRRRAVSAN